MNKLFAVLVATLLGCGGASAETINLSTTKGVQSQRNFVNIENDADPATVISLNAPTSIALVRVSLGEVEYEDTTRGSATSTGITNLTLTHAASGATILLNASWVLNRQRAPGRTPTYVYTWTFVSGTITR